MKKYIYKIAYVLYVSTIFMYLGFMTTNLNNDLKVINIENVKVTLVEEVELSAEEAFRDSGFPEWIEYMNF